MSIAQERALPSSCGVLSGKRHAAQSKGMHSRRDLLHVGMGAYSEELGLCHFALSTGG